MAPRWLKTLQRNRAPMALMPNEKSSSRDSSNRFFCASVSTLYTSAFVSEGLSGGSPSLASSPWIRICGGVSDVICKSEPPCSTSVFSKSGNVAMMVSPQPFRASLLHRLADDFFDRRDAVLHLDQAAATERDHPFVDRLA